MAAAVADFPWRRHQLTYCSSALLPDSRQLTGLTGCWLSFIQPLAHPLTGVATFVATQLATVQATLSQRFPGTCSHFLKLKGVKKSFAHYIDLHPLDYIFGYKPCFVLLYQWSQRSHSTGYSFGYTFSIHLCPCVFPLVVDHLTRSFKVLQCCAKGPQSGTACVCDLL